MQIGSMTASLKLAAGAFIFLAGSAITANASPVSLLDTTSEDQISANIGGTPVTWAQDPNNILFGEFYSTTITSIPTTFKDATVFLLEPSGDPDGALSTIPSLNGGAFPNGITNVSDIFSITTQTCGRHCPDGTINHTYLKLQFVSDNLVTLLLGARGINVAENIVALQEDGTLQDLSNYFGLDARSILVQSDAPTPVPLPTALPLFGGGLALLGFLSRRRRKPMAELAA